MKWASTKHLMAHQIIGVMTTAGDECVDVVESSDLPTPDNTNKDRVTCGVDMMQRG